MARFYSRLTTAPTGANLYSVISSIIENRRQREDDLTFTRWRNGELSDDEILDYISRRATEARDDLERAKWVATYRQVSFTIAESKILQRYYAGEATQLEVAMFYMQAARDAESDVRKAELERQGREWTVRATEAEANMMYDAWRYGAKWKGEFVTDDRLLAAIRAAADLYGPEDPGRLRWEAFYERTRFGIEESKVLTSFLEGKMTATQVAQWYKSQLRNYAPDSEIYREIARSAAQYAQQAAAEAVRRGRAAASAAAQATLDRLLQPQMKAVSTILELSLIARGRGLIEGEQSPVETMREGALVSLINEVVPGGYEGFLATLDAANAALTEAYKFAVRNKMSKSDLKKIQDAIENGQAARLAYATLDERALWREERRRYEIALLAAKGNPVAEELATRRYVERLTELLRSVESKTDIEPDFVGALRNEILALTNPTAATEGLFTPADIYGGFTEGLRGTDADGQRLAKSTIERVREISDLASGRSVLFYDPQSGRLVVTPTSAIDPSRHVPIMTMTSEGVLGAPDSPSQIWANPVRPIIGVGLTEEEMASGPLDQAIASKVIGARSGGRSKAEEQQRAALQRAIAQVGWVVETPNGTVWVLEDRATGRRFYFDRDPFTLYTPTGSPRGTTSAAFTLPDEQGQSLYIALPVTKDGFPTTDSFASLALPSMLPFDSSVIPETRLRILQQYVAENQATLSADELSDAGREMARYVDDIRAGAESRPTVIGGQVITVHPGGAVLSRELRDRNISTLADLFGPSNDETRRARQLVASLPKPPSTMPSLGAVSPGLRGEIAGRVGTQTALGATQLPEVPAVTYPVPRITLPHTEAPTVPPGYRLGEPQFKLPAAPPPQVTYQPPQFQAPTLPSLPSTRIATEAPTSFALIRTGEFSLSSQAAQLALTLPTIQLPAISQIGAYGAQTPGAPTAKKVL